MAITGARITGNDPILHGFLKGYYVGAPETAKPLDLMDDDWTQKELSHYFNRTCLSDLNLTPKDREIRQYAR